VEEHHDEDDHDEEGHDEDEHEDEHDDHGGLQRAEYMQKDAKFNGYEFQFGRKIDLANGYLDLSFGRDAVNGKFSDGTKVSRVVPARNIYSVKYANNDAYELKVTLKDVAKQDDIGEDETVTSGFRMLDLKAMKTFDFAAGSELSVSVFANNILDEVARNHTSFVKNEVPLPGRNVGVRLKLNF
jgi:iron complex outermembrane receptor protein